MDGSFRGPYSGPMADVRLVVHGHFYQPPRENPWTEEVAAEASASPFHDWNERITAECYRPNGWARVLDDTGRVEAIVNNYAHLSFDVGPTLLSWLERHEPAVYDRMIDGDGRRRGGRGGAMAQAYNHAILPLASERDIRTQVRWGLADFAHRFGRPAEGMWLPETAVNDTVLRILTEEGVRFTILAPGQAVRVRPLDGDGGDDGVAWTWTRRHDRHRAPVPLAAGPPARPRARHLVLRRSDLPRPRVRPGRAVESGRDLPGHRGRRATARRSWWPPTARPSATITSSPTGRSRSPSPARHRPAACGCSTPPSWCGRSSPPTRSSCGRARGPAPTASVAGTPTAAARPAPSPDGTNAGGHRCGPPSTSCATSASTSPSAAAPSCSTTSGRRGTPTSTCCSAARPRSEFLAAHAAAGRTGWRSDARVAALTLMEAQRHAAAHVHLVRVVLRRPRRARDRAGAPVRGPRHRSVRRAR